MSLLVKRLIDIIFSVTGLIFLSPFLLLTMVSIKIDDQGPVFFRQQRVGKDGLLFRIIKFRTMVVNAEKMGAGVFIERNDPRITKVGKLLRYMSLDELPQLFNVIKGEMSLVGPRPTLLYQVERYDERQKQRLNMKPGITGWAQINGRNELSWPEKIELDLWYVNNWKLGLDFKILWKTMLIVFSGSGIQGDSKGDYISKSPPANNNE